MIKVIEVHEAAVERDVRSAESVIHCYVELVLTGHDSGLYILRVVAPGTGAVRLLGYLAVEALLNPAVTVEDCVADDVPGRFVRRVERCRRYGGEVV